MIGALGGMMSGGLSGGGSGASGGAGPQTTSAGFGTEAGTVSNGGITVNPSFKFDPNNPMHLMGAGLVGLVVGGFVLKVLKK